MDLNYFVEIPLRKILILFLNMDLEKWVPDQPRTSKDDVEEAMLGNIDEMMKKYTEVNNKLDLIKFQNTLRELCHHLFINPSSEEFIEYPGRLSGEAIEYSIYFSSESNKFYENYSIESIDAFCLFAVTRLYSDGAVLRRCENCGDFFIPSSRADEIYCDKVIKDNKSCKDIGYTNKVKSDDLTKAYRTAYKTKNAYKVRNIKNSPDIQQKFENWVIRAKQKLQDAKDEKISADEFKAWLKKQLKGSE